MQRQYTGTQPSCTLSPWTPCIKCHPQRRMLTRAGEALPGSHGCLGLCSAANRGRRVQRRLFPYGGASKLLPQNPSSRSEAATTLRARAGHWRDGVDWAPCDQASLSHAHTRVPSWPSAEHCSACRISHLPPGLLPMASNTLCVPCSSTSALRCLQGISAEQEADRSRRL